MLRRSVFATLWIVALGTAFAVGADQPYEEYLDQTYPVSASARVSLDNVNGDVSVEVWGSDEVRIQAVKRASAPELLAELEIEIHATGDAVAIDTHYPSGRGSGNRTSVEYTLTVPRKARLDSIDLVNGDLRIIGVEGGVQAECVNGVIRASGLAGAVELETVNGALELEVSALGPGDDISLESVNGSIEILLPPGAGVSLHAESLNGSLSNDLGVEVRKGRYIGSSMVGSVGSGAVKVAAETVNGPISIRSR
jgi:DUF4097 and DUF4098 domain-containing protein YvlB